MRDARVARGANQVNGPSFEGDHPEPAYDEARRGALDKAQARAAMYAKTLGLRVRRIVSISEGGGFRPPGPVPMMAMARSTGRVRRPGATGGNPPGASPDHSRPTRCPRGLTVPRPVTTPGRCGSVSHA